MNILVMGGTLFLGRHIVDAALKRGHKVTLFNRGLQNPTLFPHLETLIGDRDVDLNRLDNRYFDVVIDPSAYAPRQIETLLSTLKKPPESYIFISSISVYRAVPPYTAYDEGTNRVSGDAGYGALKARAEDTLSKALSGRATIIRPGLIVGPFDPTDRFTYWVRRVDSGGQILAPGRAERPIQFIDARDLSNWTIHLSEAKINGVFNAVGPSQTLTMRAFLETCAVVAGKSVDFHWVSDDQLIATAIEGWTEMPLWLSETDPDDGGIFLADNNRAVSNGLSFRSITDTVTDTLRWSQAYPDQAKSPLAVKTLSPEKERQVLAHI